MAVQSESQTIPVDVIGNEWDVEHECEPFISKQKEHVEENMDGIFRQYKLQNEK